MKKILKIVATALMIAGFSSSSKAGVTLNYDLQTFTAGLNNLTGTLLLVSHGVDTLFNSNGGWANGTSSFLLGDDTLFAAVGISNGVASGALNNISAPAGSAYGTTRFTGLFIGGLTSSQINYSNAQLSGGLTFAATGTSYEWGSYRSDSIEAYSGDSTGKIAWIIPADGNTVDFWAASASAGGNIVAALNTTSTLTVIPEPSTGALMMIGAVGLVALRRLRKV
jgi:hypothetical protein